MSMSFDDSSDEEIRESGAGILEFSPAKAGLDVTPAKFSEFKRKEERRQPSGFSSFAGTYTGVQACMFQFSLKNKLDESIGQIVKSRKIEQVPQCQYMYK